MFYIVIIYIYASKFYFLDTYFKIRYEAAILSCIQTTKYKVKMYPYKIKKGW